MIKKSFFLRIGVFLFIISGVLCSCDGLLLSKSETLLSTGMCKMTVNMGFSRSAYPSSLPSTVTYYAAIYNAEKTVYLTETGSSSDPSFLENKGTNSNLSFVFKEPDNTTKGTYFLSVYGYKTGTPPDISTGLLGTSESFVLNVGQKNINTPLTITFISDNSTTTGDIALSLKLSADLLTKVSTEANITILCTNIDTDVELTQIESNISDGFLTLSGTNIPVGSYYLDITFKDTNGKWISTDYTRQTLSVYSGFVTDTWYEMNGVKMENFPINCTTDTSFYVCGAERKMYGTLISTITKGDDTTGNGSIVKPFATLQKAIDTIIAINDENSTYTIYVDGKVIDDPAIDRSTNNNAFININISSEKNLKLTIAPAPYNTSVTIDANRSSSSNNKASTMYVGASVTLTLNNVTITGGYAENGGGIYVDGGSVTLSNSTIETNEATNDGGGIYIASGSVSLNDSSVSTNTGDNGSGVYVNGTFIMNDNARVFSNNNVYLASGRRITIGSTYTAISTVTVSTEKEYSDKLPVLSGNTTNVFYTFKLSKADTADGIWVVDTYGQLFKVSKTAESTTDIFTAIENSAKYHLAIEITLQNDIVIVEEDRTTAILIESGANVTFSAANPCTITGGVDYVDSLIDVLEGGTFTLGNNVTLQGSSEYSYSAVYVAKGATFIMTEGSSITGFLKEGPIIDVSGTFTMEGGIITGNIPIDNESSQENLAAICFIWEKGLFNMKGGSITGNPTSNGFYIVNGYSTSVMDWTGGEITGNGSGCIQDLITFLNKTWKDAD